MSKLTTIKEEKLPVHPDPLKPWVFKAEDGQWNVKVVSPRGKAKFHRFSVWQEAIAFALWLPSVNGSRGL